MYDPTKEHKTVSDYFKQHTKDYSEEFKLPPVYDNERYITQRYLDAKSQSEYNNGDNNTSFIIPDILWRSILEMLFTPMQPSRILHLNNTTTSNINKLIIFIRKYGTVSKRWAHFILPYLDYGTVEICNDSQLRYLYKLLSTGITTTCYPFKIKSITIGGTITQAKELQYLNQLVDLKLDNITISIPPNSIHKSIQAGVPLNREVSKLISRTNPNQLVLKNLEAKCDSVLSLDKLRVKIFKQATNITELDLGNNRMGPIILEYIAPLLTGTESNIIKLNLENNILGVEGARRLSVLLEHNQSLRILNLSFNLIKSGIKELSESLLKNYTLTKLNLNENYIDEFEGVPLITLLANSKNIKSLDISGNPMGDTINNILKAAQSNGSDSLRELSIASNATKQINLDILALYVQATENLNTLNMHRNTIKNNESLLEALIHNKSITSLDISYASISQSAFSTVARVITINETLKSLYMSFAFQHSNLEDISNALANNNTITYLDLSLNTLKANDGKTIGEMLLNNTSLTHLNIGGNEVTANGAKCILESLLVNNTLKFLNISQNAIHSLPKGLLFSVLSKAGGLTHFDISSNSLVEANGKELAISVAYNTTLTQLNISSNRFPPTVGLILTESLTFNRTLEKIVLSNNSFGGHVVEMLKTKYEKKFNQFILASDYGPNTLPSTSTINSNTIKKPWFFLSNFEYR